VVARLALRRGDSYALVWCRSRVREADNDCHSSSQESRTPYGDESESESIDATGTPRDVCRSLRTVAGVHVIATAGHVDHGKSTLVRALTGTDPDRLAEEKSRGLTIDLGFAWTRLRSGHEVAFVDVPGHVRFIKNMLAGVGAVDTCLFVVAATEGWKPQSEEHLRILDLLGFSSGVVALTKASLLDVESLEQAVGAVREHLEDTFLADAPIVPTDAPSGLGLEQLCGALAALAESTRSGRDQGRPRLWIDRCFSAAGSGTVVTGTLTGGGVRLHDELHIVPGPASGRPLGVRVRAIQTYGLTRDAVGPGERVALGLLGSQERLNRTMIEHGQSVVRLSQWSPTNMVDATLDVLEDAPAPISRRGAYCAYIGSGEHTVRLRVLGATSIAPGETGAIRLRLPVLLTLMRGDRFVLRDVGRQLTVGGGEVLDVAPVLPGSRARPDRSVERVIAERGWTEADELERLTGERRAATVGDRWVVHPELLAESQKRLREAIEAAGSAGVDIAAFDERGRLVLGTLVDAGVVWVGDGRARAAGQQSDLAASPYLQALEAAPFAPPEAASFDVDRAEIRELVSAGLVFERDGHYFAASAVAEGAQAVAELLATSPEGVTVSAVRERLASTRKYVVPFLALLDAEGITRRRGDVRIAGPRLPGLASGSRDTSAMRTDGRSEG
jgi:selenocysteine-specific elongation factor